MTVRIGWLVLLYLGVACVSGLLLSWHYVPAPELAYLSIVDLQSVSSAGKVLRSLHYFATHFAIAFTVLHIVLVLVRPGTAPRSQWASGLGCLVLAVLIAYSGRILPWDQHGGVSLVVLASFLGVDGAAALLGGGAVQLQRVFVLHLVGTALLVPVLRAHVDFRVAAADAVAAPSWRRALAIAAGGLVLVTLASVVWPAPLGRPYAEEVAGAAAEWYLRWVHYLALRSALWTRVVLVVLCALGLASPVWDRVLGARRVTGAWAVTLAAMVGLSLLPAR
jgi:ubiquinol-cytochrome c reductase cytochrome b subunit